jgi:futalosine hydrolase
MTSGLAHLLKGKKALLAFATPLEARAALHNIADPAPWTLHTTPANGDVVITGIGKANAAGGVARVLDPDRHGLVISLGIAGALPRDNDPMLPLGLTVVATACPNADEGLATPEGFVTCEAMGFPLGSFKGAGPAVDPAVARTLRQVADFEGPVATVSTCSGTDALAREVARRTGAVAEAMEGAAVAQVAHRLGVLFGELRVISNTTGDRPRQRWDLRGAIDRLSEVLGLLKV